MKVLTVVFLLVIPFSVLAQNADTGFINHQKIARKNFGNDADWYLKNIPFFECSDKQLQQVYYYRWKLFKAHLRNIGKDGYIVTEFLNAMKWDLKPYNSLNDATVFHIYEGRWLRDKRYMRDYIRYMYQKGGNDRHFSEAIADAAFANYLVNPDKKFIMAQLPAMLKIYKAWDDHFDFAKKLYFIEPINDATEYTIASIDASGGKDGFKGGYAFRPSINSYMYANALAIKNIALLKKDTALAWQYQQKAYWLKQEIQKNLWNADLKHFTDRFAINNSYIKCWDFIRGRELVGYVPWVYHLPDDNQMYNKAWEHLVDKNQFNGKFGLRTVEPSYPYYMKQYRYDKATGLKECQWNGPSWPYQTTQVLMAMANVLNDYHQSYITAQDYINQLEKYAGQHFHEGELNLLENYNRDNRKATVNIDERSEHYNHSGFGNLIITGLCGIRPSVSDTLKIYPLIDSKISYLCLENLNYHGQDLTIIYDQTGQKYKQGKGISVLVNGKRAQKLNHYDFFIPHKIQYTSSSEKEPINLAVNLSGNGYPKAKASYTDSLDHLNMAIDGRIWNFQDVRNRWSCYGSGNKSDWFELTFDSPQKIGKIKLFFYEDKLKYKAPEKVKIEYKKNKKWHSVSLTTAINVLKGNTENPFVFKSFSSKEWRVTFKNAGNGFYTALSEIECYKE